MVVTIHEVDYWLPAARRCLLIKCTTANRAAARMMDSKAHIMLRVTLERTSRSAIGPTRPFGHPPMGYHATHLASERAVSTQ